MDFKKQNSIFFRTFNDVVDIFVVVFIFGSFIFKVVFNFEVIIIFEVVSIFEVVLISEVVILLRLSSFLKFTSFLGGLHNLCLILLWTLLYGTYSLSLANNLLLA